MSLKTPLNVRRMPLTWSIQSQSGVVHENLFSLNFSRTDIACCIVRQMQW
jgi:hypothetical protein